MKKSFLRNVIIANTVLLGMIALANNVFAATDQPKIDSGDTAWLLASTALVFVMTPGVAFFYGGMVRKKNVITTMLQVFAVIAIVSVQWVVFGYSLAFGPDINHIIGGLQWVFLKGVGAAPDPDYASTIPNLVFSFYQMTFAIITPALVVGSLAERVKFSSFVVFITLWATFIYDPLAHWVWGAGGWLRNLGVLDFAGGTVVHIGSGVSGLVTALYLGKRTELGSKVLRAHNVPFVLLGTALLWFGWFGFNAGSALGANYLSAEAFIATNTAAAAGLIGWLIIEKLRTGHVTLMGACGGAVAGLVAITPAAGFVNATAAIVIGLVAGFLCFYASCIMKEKLGYDDALDAFGGHGIGGTWGAIATGLFATTAVNSGAANGLFYGNPKQLLVQLIGIVAAWLFSAIGTFILIKIVDKIMGFRVTKEEELMGLDYVLHRESAYPEQLSTDELPQILNESNVVFK